MLVAVPSGVTLRTELFPVSATSTLPSLSTKPPLGALNWALIPVPLAKPATPDPARLVTTTSLVIQWMILVSGSRLPVFARLQWNLGQGLLAKPLVVFPPYAKSCVSAPK